jgi:uncharacterized SAM-binding protein YcdF (DUF218 family)
LPPGIFVLLIFLGAFLYKDARKYLLFIGTVFYLLTTKVVGTFLLSPFEKPYNHIHTPTEVDATVILAGGTDGKNANLTLGTHSFKRVMYGIMVSKKESLPIIFSGKGVGAYTEDISMKDTIKELNNYLDINLTETKTIKPHQFSIFYEDKSVNTFENAKFTKEIFSSMGIDTPRIYLVTSAFHLKRSITLYEHFGFKVIPVATDFMCATSHGIEDFVPSNKGLHMSYFALHEYVGLYYLKIKFK